MGLQGMIENIQDAVQLPFIILGILFGLLILTMIFANIGPGEIALTPDNPGYNISAQIQEDSLEAIKAYSSQSSTQINVSSIAIVLVILIGVYILFHNVFIIPRRERKKEREALEKKF